MRERTITVDINKNYHKSLNYKQYDNNNVLNIIIKEDDNLVDITSYTARAFYQLPSKTVIQRNTTKNGKNTIKLKIDKVILAESGRISLEVVINNVDTVVTTFTLFIDVEKSIDRNEAIEGYPEWDIIADGLSHLDDVENRMSIAENEIVDIESEVSTVKNRVSTVEGEVADIKNEVTDARNGETTLKVRLDKDIQQTEEKINIVKNEVIDARDGEASLKVRLDRDIEKAKEIYVGVEGTYVSTDSSSGYAKYVEILGNTIQNAENLADIRSVGDKVEGQELYEIPVVSSGKNLFDGNEFTSSTPSNQYSYIDGILTMNCDGQMHRRLNYTLPNTLIHGKRYILTANVKVLECSSDYTPGQYFGYGFYNAGSESYYGFFDASSNTTKLEFIYNEQESNVIGFHNDANDGLTKLQWSNIQLEEGTQATPYEPYQEDKLTILSPVQLEKVGDVRDRIIEKDGVWGIEKNIVTKILDSSESWYKITTNSENYSIFALNIDDLKTSSCVVSNRIPTHPEGAIYNACNSFCIGTHNIPNVLRVCIESTKLTSDDIVGFKEWIKLGSDLLIKYTTTNPTFIPLPHSQQVKLRTFANKTNISFGCEIEGTIKAQVPKSLGATVNTHTEQIGNLSKELDRVKKLEESTVSTVVTESDFTTVEETSNGYFEDVKLEGRTLVNLCSNFRLLNIHPYQKCIELKVSPNTKYTVIVPIYNNHIYGIYDSTGQNSIVPYRLASMRNIFIFTSDNNTDFKLYCRMLDDQGELSFEGELNKNACDIIILEGDHTQNPPSYFEGLKSVGDGVDEVSVESVNENLIKLDSKIVKENGITYEFKDDGSIIANGTATGLSELILPVLGSDKIDTNIFNGKTVSLSGCPKDGGSNKYRLGIVSTEPAWKNLNDVGNGCSCTIDLKDGREWTIRLTIYQGQTVNNLVFLPKLQFGSNISNYQPHQSDKKPLLYYNPETQTWEKPILRQWDSIEKHADGKYYYHKRSGEVVLNGSESSWGQGNLNGVALFSIDIGSHIGSLAQPHICDKFKDTQNYALLETTEYGMYSNSTRLYFRPSFNISDLDSFKQWLQANNVTVVYQLAQEKVYECTNIDLITYADETNYTVNSGAIVPKSTLKVHNNISNVVRELQIKVSTLESYIQYTILNALKNALNE